jgi:hypothetical protein
MRVGSRYLEERAVVAVMIAKAADLGQPEAVAVCRATRSCCVAGTAPVASSSAALCNASESQT